MTQKILLPKIFRGRGARVGCLVGYESDPELWPTYTPRTFWAIPWINYESLKILSKIVKKLGHLWGAISGKSAAISKRVPPHSHHSLILDNLLNKADWYSPQFWSSVAPHLGTPKVGNFFSKICPSLPVQFWGLKLYPYKDSEWHYWEKKFQWPISPDGGDIGGQRFFLPSLPPQNPFVRISQNFTMG